MCEYNPPVTADPVFPQRGATGTGPAVYAIGPRSPRGGADALSGIYPGMEAV